MPHTPGPWKAEFLGEDKNIVIRTEQNPEGILNIYPTKEAKANAALISKSPELLEAAEHMLACLKATRDFYTAHEAPYDENVVSDLVISEVMAEEKLRNIAAAAKGE